jgi:multisubunit Na+/H+ antiporter MnhB subunit
MVARSLLAPTLVVAVAILVKGYAGVGDGFAAGIVASLGVLLQVVAFGEREVRSVLPLDRGPAVAVAGLAIGVGVLAVPLLFGGAPLEHWPPPGEEPVHVGTLELITAVVFDVAVFLLVLGSAVAIIESLLRGEEEEQE